MPLSLLNINVFICLRRTHGGFLLSLAPHQSFLSIQLFLRHQDSFLPSPKKTSAKTVSHPRTQNCLAQFVQQNLKNFKSTFPYQFTSLKSVFFIGYLAL